MLGQGQIVLVVNKVKDKCPEEEHVGVCLFWCWTWDHNTITNDGQVNTKLDVCSMWEGIVS